MMTAAVCHTCHRWWCHNAGATRNFRYITRHCPNCLSKTPKAGL